MDTSRFIIIGANGQLGTALRQKYPKAQAVDSAELDITDAAAVANFDWTRVTTILNAAAYTNVDGSETMEGRVVAWKVNANGVRNLAAAALQHNLTLVHISSEYVFDGGQSNHREDEPFSPIGVYAQSKAAGDIAASLLPQHYILRTSWVIGEGKNFVRTMIDLAQKAVSATVVSDQIGRLTFTATLVDAIDHLLGSQAAYGTYNVSNGGTPASWADVARQVFAANGRGVHDVTNTTTAEYFANKPEAAPRPLHSSFDLAKIKQTGLQLRDWHDDLHDYILSETTKEAT